MTGRVVRDLRTAWRGLLRARGLSLAAMISLAIGIGANLTAFALLRAVEFPILPYPDASRLVQIDAANESRQARGYPLSLPDYDDLRARSSVFADLGVSVDRTVTLDDGREPVRLSIKSASASYFTTLGVQPELGRAFTAVDIDGGTFTLIVLSHRVWTERYGRDPQLVGRTVRLDRTPFTVVGVMPSQFDENVEAWIPLVTDLRPTRDDRRYLVVGRLAPGATIERARAEVTGIAGGLAADHPSTNANWTMSPIPLSRLRARESGGGYYQLQGAVGVLLLAVCANVANLLLARSVGRRREMAVRSALGASRTQLARLALFEGLLLALAGGAAAILLSLWGVLAATALGQFPSAIHVPFDALTILAALTCAILSGILIAALPAFDAARSGAGRLMLESGARGATASRRQVWLRALLVAAEIAAALVLVTGASLMARTLWNRQNRDLGFDPRNAVKGDVTFDPAASDATVRDVVSRILERVATSPGVHAAGVSAYPIDAPFGSTIPLRLPGSATGSAPRSANDALGETVPRIVQSISPDYFAAMDTRMRAGRTFSSADREGAPAVAIVNETMARQIWKGRDPIGEHITLMAFREGQRASEPPRAHVLTIVGVSADTLRSAMHERVLPSLFVPFNQFPGRAVTIVVRSPVESAGAMTRAVFAIDRTLVVDNVETLESDWAAFLRPTRFYAILLVIFGALTLVLAATGVFASMAYSVSQRTRELGIRLALGADGRDLVRLILGQGLRLAAAGILGGVVVSLATSRILAGLLYGVAPEDPLTLVAVAVLLLAVVLAACYWPARRTADVDPVVALRME